MNTHEAKRRMPVERSYSSASSTTSSRLSGRRKRRRMKHTVMPLKKRPGRHELACDVHRVSNLDREEMAQSACFWVAKNPAQSGERSFKEEVFVNRDEEFLDEDASYYIENVRQSRQTTVHGQTDEITSRTDSRSTDANYSEEKTFYGLRKGKISDGVEVEEFSPLSSPRNQSRLSSVSDDSHSALSSDGAGMHVGWTSDINNSSGPEYSGANDEESEGEKAGRRPRKNIRSINDEWEESMESHGDRRRRDDESRDEYGDSGDDKPTSKGQRREDLVEPSDDQHGVVLARDMTSSETKERVDTYESETHSHSSQNGFHSPRDPRGTYLPGTEIGVDSTANGRGFYPSDKVRDSERPDVSTGGKARGDFGSDYDRSESRPLESSGYGEVPVFDTGIRTSTPTHGEHPSSDTELLAQRSFDVDEDQLSAHSLPVIDHHKTTTKYYSVEELRGISDTGPSEGGDDRGSEGPHVPRGYGEYEKYEPPRYSRSNDDSAYDVAKPRHVRGTGEGFDEGDKENRSPQKERDHLRDEEGWEESKEFYGYRRQKDNHSSDFPASDVSDKPRSRTPLRGGLELSDGQRRFVETYDVTESTGRVENFERQKSGTSARDSRDSRDVKDRDTYPEKDVRDSGYLDSGTRYLYPGADTVKPEEEIIEREQQSETQSEKDHRSTEDKWEESEEIYSYRRRQDDGNYAQDERWSGPGRETIKLGEDVVKREQQYQTLSQRDHRSTEDKWEESREFYGYRRRQDDDNYPQDENRSGLGKDTVKPGEEIVKREHQSDTLMSEAGHGSTEDRLKESRESYGYRRRQDDEEYSQDENRGGPRKEIIKPGEVIIERGQQPETLMSERDQGLTGDRLEESRECYGYRRRQDDENYPQDENRGGPGKDTVKPGEEAIEREQQPDKLVSERDHRSTEDRLEESREFYGYRRRQDDENYPHDENRGGPRKEIIKLGEVVIERGQQPDTLMSERDHGSTEDRWEESREFYGYRRHQDDGNYPQDENRGGLGKDTVKPGEEAIEREQQPDKLVSERDHGSTEDRLEESREFYGYRRRQDDGNYPQDENRGGPRKEIIKPGEMVIERGQQPDTLMSERDHRSKEEKWEESGEFYGYRRPLDDEYYSRSAATDSYDKPKTGGQRFMDLEPNGGQRNFEEPMEVTSPPSYGRDGTPTDERAGYISGKALRDMLDSGGYYRPTTDQDVPPGREYLVRREEPVTMSRPADDRQSIITRGYDVTSQRTQYSDQSVRESRESNVAYNKQQTSETEVQEMRPEPNYGPSYPGDRHDRGDYVTREESRDKYKFIGYELPSSKMLGPKPGFQGTTETTAKRLHTRSQRDTIRREARHSDSKSPDTVSDPGIRTSKPTPSPRKHGHPPTSDGNKELPTKIRKPAEKVELSKSDPEFAQKFQEIADKRKKKVKTKHSAKTTTNSTTATTKSAAESCNKNVDELVNIFNTLEHLQKPADGKRDKNVAPRYVKKIVKERTLNTPPGKDGKLSPATSISQKLQEIEHILDSVDKNNKQMSREGTGFKPKRQDSYQSSEDGRSTRSSESFNETAKSSDYSEMDTQSSLVTYTTSETRETPEKRQTHETRGKHAWRRDRHGDQPPEMVTKQETMLVESYVESTPDVIFREPRAERSEQPDSERPWSRDGGYPVTRRPFYSDRAPYNSDERNRNVQRSRDDDDEIYRAQIRKERESSWKGRSSRKKYHESRAYSDGEVEGFRTPFYNRVITPGTPVNIRLYGLNLEKTCLDRSQDIEWAQFGEWEVPVDETISRTEMQRRPQVEEIPGGKPPVRESDIEKSQARPGPGIKWNYPPSFNVHDTRKDQSRDGTVTRQEIKWSHPPVSKVRPETLQKSKAAEVQSPGTQETDIPQAMDDYNDNADQPQEKTQKPEHTFDVTESSRRETIHRNISVKSVRRQSSEEHETRTHSKSRTYPPRRISASKHPSENNPSGKRPSEESPTEERPLEERLSEERPTEERPTEECPSEERPTESLPSEERPSEERPYGSTSPEELPVYINAQIWTNETPDELFVEIEYPRIMELSQAEPEIELMDVTDGQLNDEPPEIPGRSSAPKERPESPGWTHDKNVDENTSHVNREEESSSERHESSTRMDHTIHTTRTTRTTRTTTETFVKKVRTSGSESTKPDEFIPASGEPGGSTPASSETDGKPKSEGTSLVAHEYIEVNADTGRPVNLTMLGRVVEDDDEDDLSSQSREDLFLHTRLKIVTEKKMMRPGELPEDVNAHLRGPTTAEQAMDGVDEEGELTDSEHEFEPCIDSVPIDSDHDVTEQLLIPISRLKDERDLVEEDVEKTEVDDKRARALSIENNADHDIVNEPISRTKVDQPKSEVPENVARDSLEDVFSPRVADEEEIGKERVPLKELPHFELVPGFMDAITDERVESSEKPTKPYDFLNFDEPMVSEEVNEEVSRDSVDEIVLPPVDECVTAESAPSDEAVVPDMDQLVSERRVFDERMSRESVAIPTLPEFEHEHEPVDEMVTSEKRDVKYDFPDFQVAEPEDRTPEPVDERVSPPQPLTMDIYIVDLNEMMPEVEKPQSPILVDEVISPKVTVTRDHVVPDFQEVMPEYQEPPVLRLVDENVSSTEKDNEPDIPDFQEVVPEFTDLRPTFIDDDPTPLDEDVKSEGFPECQEPVEEPARNLSMTDSDLEVEVPMSSSHSLSTESEPSAFLNIEIINESFDTNDDVIDTNNRSQSTYDKTKTKTEYFEVPEKPPEPETRTENEVITETHTQETITIEKTVRKNVHYVSEIPVRNEAREAPESPRKGVSFASPKDYSDAISESSSETSLQSSSLGSADASSEIDGSIEVTSENVAAISAARRRRNRRGNRFDNIKRSGSLVPESVVSKSDSPECESVGSKVPRSDVPRSNVPGVNVPRFDVPESRVPDNEDDVGKKTDVGEPGTYSPFKPERPSRLRPELYLLSSDDGSDSERVGDVPEAEDTTKAVEEETCIPQEKLQVAEASPEETEPSPEAVGEMAQSEEEREIPVEIAEELEEFPEELPVQGSKVPLEKEAESAPEEEVEELSQEQIDELLEKEVRGLPDVNGLSLLGRGMEKAPETEGGDQLPDKETPEAGEDEEDGLTKEKAEVIFEELSVVEEKLVESFQDEELPEELVEKEREKLQEEEIGKSAVKEDEVLSEDELQVSEEFEKSLLQETEEFPKEEREESPEENIETSVDEDDTIPPEDDTIPPEDDTILPEDDTIPPEGEPMEVPEKVEESCLENVKPLSGEEDGVLVGISEEIEKCLEEKRKDSSEEHSDESEGEEIEKLCEEHEGSIDEGNESEEEFPEVEIDVLAEKMTVPEESFEEKTSPLAKDFTEIPVDVSDDEKNKDEEPTSSSDDDASGSQTDVFGGVSRKEESTVETIIVEKTHSEVCTTVTEITTKRIPGTPTSYSSEDEGDFVQILVDIDDESQDDVVGVVQSEPADEITESDDDKPKSDDDYVNIPVQLETTERDIEAQVEEGSDDEIDPSEKQPILERASEEESLNSETSPKEAEETINLDECVSLEDRSDDKIPVQTVFGILDIQYEAPQIHEVDFLESSFEETLKLKYSEFPTLEDIRKPDDVPEPDDVPDSDDVPESDDLLECEDVLEPDDVPESDDVPELDVVPESDDVPEPEIVLELEIAPEFEQAPEADGLPKPEDVPTKDDDVVFEISAKEEESSASDDGYDGVGSGAWVVIPVQRRDGESQTENDKYSETTQTEETTRTTREISSITEEAYGANSRILNDSEMQTEMALCSSTTQTDSEINSDFESSSQRYSYKRKTEDTTDTYEDEITRVERERHCSDSQTQTDVPVGDFGSQTHVHKTTESCSMTDDDIRSAATTNEGTQTENKREDGFFNETELTRTIRKTTTETRTKTSYHDQESTSSSDNQKSDCPVCLQSLEATQYSFIKVTDLSRFVVMQDFGGQTEFDENVTDSESEFCFSCGRRQSTEGHRGTREESRTTVDKWEQDVVVQSESSSSATSSGDAHFAIHVEGDDKCSLLCRRVGNHSCMLQKLASIIQANRRATTADRGAATSAHVHQHHEVSETGESSETSQEVTKEADVDSGESLGNGACAVIGGDRCDVSVQTDGAVLSTDLEVFSEKDFEIYYDGQKSPLCTAMTIVQGMQKEQENLIKQLDVLREVNQNLRDQKDAIQAAHEAQSAEFVSLSDELAFAQNLERAPAKIHRAVTRQGSEMSKYFATFDEHSGVTRTNSRLISVDEAGEANSRSGSGKRRLHRTKASTQSIQSSSSAQHLIELASESDGAEFECDRVFEEGELKESERPEWMEKVHSAIEPVMSAANRKKTKREVGERQTDIAPQYEVDGAEFQDDRVFKERELKEGDKPEWIGKVHSTTEPGASEAERMKAEREFGERRTNIVSQSTVEGKSSRKLLTSSDGVQFKEGELRESEGHEWMEKVNSATEPVMSEAERMKTEREFREHKTNIVPQSTVEGKSSRKLLTSSDGVQFKEGELRESEGHEWMEKVNSATEPVMSEAERVKTEREFREHKTNIVPQSTVEGKSSRKLLTSSDGVQFKEGELRESEGHEWMEKVNSATEPVMSEAERVKTEREFREHKTNIVPQSTVEGKSSRKLLTSSDGVQFKEGELRESEGHEWMEKVNSATEPVMSEAERMKTEREFREHKTNIVPQSTVEGKSSRKLLTSSDGVQFKEGELRESEGHEWMEKVNSATEPVMSEAERVKTEREFREHKTNIVPQSTVEGKSSRKLLTSSDGVQFKEGELRESEGHEWMVKVNSATEPVMSEAERMKTEREFREHKTNIVPQLTVVGKSSHKSPTTEEEEEEEEAGSHSSERTLSPRTSPVGTETETKHVHNTSMFPATNSHLQRLYKVVFVGDSGVGKSSFIHRYCYEIWKPSYTATIGVDFQVKSLEIDMKKLALQLWDTAGQERFRSITKQYFRKADGVVLLYDLTSEASFVNIKSWMTSVEEAAEPGCTVMLVGNKLDLCKDDERYRAVEFTNAEELAEEYGALYAEASAKTGENVNEAMEILAKRLQEEEDWQLHSVLNLKLDDEKKKKKSCCSR